MYNYFVIVGPESDPAGIAGQASAKDAFSAIAKSGSKFISRGDDSGTNKAELKLWDAAAIDPSNESWYVSAGKGMGACLLQAAEAEGYCLTDKATFLSMENKGGLKILLGESDDMKNTYSMIAVNPDKNAGVNIDGANAFIEWMLGAKAQGMIKEYGSKEYGEPLFFLIEK
jgi:tungstate transport system substrate-binding protein